MNPKEDAFTDASQLDEMNRTVWKTLGGNHQTVGDAPPELDDSLPRAQSTLQVGDAEEAELEVRGADAAIPVKIASRP